MRPDHPDLLPQEPPPSAASWAFSLLLSTVGAGQARFTAWYLNAARLYDHCLAVCLMPALGRQERLYLSGVSGVLLFLPGIQQKLGKVLIPLGG